MKGCGWPGCRKQVETWRWGCSAHWHMLPPNLQQKIKLDMQGAELEVHAWIVRTFGAEQRRDEYNPGRWETLVRMIRTRDDARARRRAAKGETDGRTSDADT